MHVHSCHTAFWLSHILQSLHSSWKELFSIFAEIQQREYEKGKGTTFKSKKVGMAINQIMPKLCNQDTVKLGDKEWFDKEHIGVKEPFPVTNLPIIFIRIRNICR